MEGLKTGDILILKDEAVINYKEYQLTNKHYPVWEIGYSNLTNSDLFYDVIPLTKFSTIDAVITPFFLEIEKEKVEEFFIIIRIKGTIMGLGNNDKQTPPNTPNTQNTPNTPNTRYQEQRRVRQALRCYSCYI